MDGLISCSKNGGRWSTENSVRSTPCCVVVRLAGSSLCSTSRAPFLEQEIKPSIPLSASPNFIASPVQGKWVRDRRCRRRRDCFRTSVRTTVRPWELEMRDPAVETARMRQTAGGNSPR